MRWETRLESYPCVVSARLLRESARACTIRNMQTNPYGVPVVVSPALPVKPGHREDARRIVRHGYADVLAWLDQEVGPAPGEPTHSYMGMDAATGGGPILFVSRQECDRLRKLNV